LQTLKASSRRPYGFQAHTLLQGVHSLLAPPLAGDTGAPALGLPKMLPATPQAHAGEKPTLRSHLRVHPDPQLSLIHQMPAPSRIRGKEAQPSLGKVLGIFMLLSTCYWKFSLPITCLKSS